VVEFTQSRSIPPFPQITTVVVKDVTDHYWINIIVFIQDEIPGIPAISPPAYAATQLSHRIIA
jgi:hypothetical protein